MKTEEFEPQIVDLLGRISHELFIHSRRLVRRTGLTRPQLAALLALLGEDELPTGALARRLSLSAPTLSGILDRLERKGLVERRRGARDRRAVWVSAAPGAHACLEAGTSLLGPAFSDRLAELDAEEKRRIIESLHRLAGLLGESPHPPSEPLIEAGLASAKAPLVGSSEETQS